MKTKLKTVVVNMHYDSSYDVRIDRQTKWGNPFKVGSKLTRQQAVESYEAYIRACPSLMAELPKLKGKRLGCWCKPKACHGDILVKLIEELA